MVLKHAVIVLTSLYYQLYDWIDFIFFSHLQKNSVYNRQIAGKKIGSKSKWMPWKLHSVFYTELWTCAGKSQLRQRWWWRWRGKKQQRRFWNINWRRCWGYGSSACCRYFQCLHCRIGANGNECCRCMNELYWSVGSST